jgi:putative two-component system response regulator
VADSGIVRAASRGNAKMALVVEDEVHVRSLIARWLTDEGFQCLQAEDAHAAGKHLRTSPIDLVTLDITLPGRSGAVLLDEVFASNPDAVVLMITALREARTAIDVLRRGASGYLVKPITREQLSQQVRKTMAQRKMLIERRQHTERLEQQLQQQTVAIRRAHEETIHRLLAASSCRDVETSMHILRTGLLAEALARAKGWSPAECENIRLAAPMHDVGKIGIPDAILRKPSKLSRDEFAIMKSHTTIGADMLEGSGVPMLQMARHIALSHHERFNGGGYPFGLVGNEIPESARIMAVVDAYDSLTHERVYRRALPEKSALHMLRRGAGRNFDPDLVWLFFENLPALRGIAKSHPDEPCEGPDYGLKCLPRELAALGEPALV